MTLGLAFLKPLLLPVVKLLVGRFVTPENMRHVVDVVFAQLHAVVDKLPTHGVALTALEAEVNKDELAKELADFLEAQL